MGPGWHIGTQLVQWDPVGTVGPGWHSGTWLAQWDPVGAVGQWDPVGAVGPHWCSGSLNHPALDSGLFRPPSDRIWCSGSPEPQGNSNSTHLGPFWTVSGH